MEPSVCVVTSNENSDFVTVVSVGTPGSTDQPNANEVDDACSSAYVTVLKIGDSDNSDKVDVLEEIIVYRLPGERLGFGLKFEGGVRATELVKRLFIQSCAPDSPASRATTTWGHLVEGDEILEIDSVPVKKLSRIDCVRSLKDSNLLIRLLIKHDYSQGSALHENDNCIEDVATETAETKRTPPPPPPVPPRKIPRKLLKSNNKGFSESNPEATLTPPPRQNQNENNQNGYLNNRLQSPGNSRRNLQAPEVAKRERKLSKDALGPPDAEIYVDLISQECSYSLSESDDTGSSISTVVDRLGSFPNTTESSVCGSLPSTPTAIQRHLDFMNHFDKDDENFIDNKLYLYSVNGSQENDEKVYIGKTNNKDKSLESSSENAPLQPPVNFQDAALSYGNEDVKVVEAAIKIVLEANESKEMLQNAFSKGDIANEVEVCTHVNSSNDTDVKQSPLLLKYINENNNNTIHNEGNYDMDDMNIGLPRLVDFVPKLNKCSSETEKHYEERIKLVKLFLENEKRIAREDITPYTCKVMEIDGSLENGYESPCVDFLNWSNTSEYNTFNWNPSSQLATIGEVEEEGLQDQCQR